MSPQAQLVMLLWLPFVLYIFKRYSPSVGVMVGIIGGWLFLPWKSGFKIPLLPAYDKMGATGYSALVGVAIFDSQRFNKFKLGSLEYPMLLWCISSFISSISNGLGPYDGLASSLAKTMTWGVPYFLGRIYFNNLAGIRELAIGIFAAGVIYVPLALYEIRMSPVLHKMIYGGYPRGIASIMQAKRYGGFRPFVFMEHGLELGVWFMATSLIGIWLWRSGVLKKLWNQPMILLIPLMLITFVLVKSTGAWGLLGFGLTIMLVAQFLKLSLPLVGLVLLIFYYLYIACTGLFHGGDIIAFLYQLGIPYERVSSLEFRFANEEIMGGWARHRILFGWGGWGRNFPPDFETIPDSLYIQIFGVNGMFGVLTWGLAILLPVCCFCLRYPAKNWFHPKVAPAAAIATVLPLYVLDCLQNSMINPIYAFMCGGLTVVASSPQESLKDKPSKKSSKPRYAKSTPQQSQVRKGRNRQGHRRNKVRRSPKNMI